MAGGKGETMLKDEIKRVKRENPGSIETKTGACRFCGQMASLEVPGDWGGQLLDEAATELCTCWEAESYTRKKGQKERAIKAIEEQFGEKAEECQVEEEVRKIMEEVAGLAVEDLINSATIDVGDGLKAKIGLTSKGTVKVERIKTAKTAKEA